MNTMHMCYENVISITNPTPTTQFSLAFYLEVG